MTPMLTSRFVKARPQDRGRNAHSSKALLAFHHIDVYDCPRMLEWSAGVTGRAWVAFAKRLSLSIICLSSV